MSLNVSIASNVDQKPKRQTQQQKDKGQLISKCPFGVIVSTKISKNFLRITALAFKKRSNKKVPNQITLKYVIKKK